MAKDTVKVGAFPTVLEQRISSRLKRMDPAGKEIRAVLTRIGIMIEGEAKLNIRRKRIIDTGALFNSIKYNLFTNGTVSGVTVGSYGVPYAAVHEFGFSGPVNVPTHTRTQTMAWGRPISARAVTVKDHIRNMRMPARPFLRPAIRKYQVEILELIKGLVLGGKK